MKFVIPFLVLAVACENPSKLDTVRQHIEGTALCQEGTLNEGELNDWNFSCLDGAEERIQTIVQVVGGDNSGTVVTGIDAVGNSITVGTVITVCNTNGPQDAGVVAFAPEQAGSTAGNRIWTPSYGRDQDQVTTEHYILGPSACVDLIYMQPNQEDENTLRWVMRDNQRFGTAQIGQLSIYPESRPDPISGTVNDWNPDDTSFMYGGEAGTSIKSTARSVIIIRTEDEDGAIISGVEYTGGATPDGHGPVKILCNAGPGPVTLSNLGAYGASDGQNMMMWGQGGADSSIVLEAGDPCVMMWHRRDFGTWLGIGRYDSYHLSAKQVEMTKGLTVSTTDTSMYSAVEIVAPESAELPGLHVRSYNTGGAADGIRLRSGDTSYYAAYSLGRTTTESWWAVAADSNHFVSGTAAGDGVLAVAGSGRRLHIGTSFGATPNIVCNADNSVDFNGPINMTASGSQIHSGAGSPEGVIAAPVGSLYLRTDGGSGTSLYVKQSGGVGNTGWAGK